VISHDAILTAAHCLYNARVGRFIPAEELHFLVGYRTGNYSTHARIASYQIGPGFEIGMSHLHRGISARFNARLPQNLRVRQLQSLSLATGAATSAMPLHARSYLNLRGLGLAG
jgi:hypothetical protein